MKQWESPILYSLPTLMFNAKYACSKNIKQHTKSNHAYSSETIGFNVELNHRSINVLHISDL